MHARRRTSRRAVGCEGVDDTVGLVDYQVTQLEGCGQFGSRSGWVGAGIFLCNFGSSGPPLFKDYVWFGACARSVTDTRWLGTPVRVGARVKNNSGGQSPMVDILIKS